MPILQGRCNSFVLEMPQGIHNFTATTGDVFKLALYTVNANLGPTTTVYTSAGEVTGFAGYTAGGATLTNVTPYALTITSATTGAGINFSGPVVFSNVAGLVARGALIYNSSKANRAVAVLDFGIDRRATQAGTFTVTFPAVTTSSALIPLA